MNHLLFLPLVQWALQLLFPPGVWALSDDGGHLSVESPPMEESVSQHTIRPQSVDLRSLLAPPTSHLSISRT